MFPQKNLARKGLSQLNKQRNNTTEQILDLSHWSLEDYNEIFMVIF